MRAISFIAIVIFGFCSQLSAQTYTWTGATDTDWSTSTNWSPIGVPDSLSKVVLNGGANSPTLSADSKVYWLDMNSGTLDLAGYTLEVKNFIHINGDHVTDGTIYSHQTNSGGDITVIDDCVLDCKLDLYTPRAVMSNSVFNDTVKIHQSAGWAISSGANKFNEHLHIIQGIGSLTLGNTIGPDSVMSTFVREMLTTSSTGFLGGAHGVYCGGETYLRNRSSSMFLVKNVEFDGNVHIGSSNATSRFEFGTNGGDSVLITSGHSIQLDTMGFSANILRMYNTRQEGSEIIDLSDIGTTKLYTKNSELGGDLLISDDAVTSIYHTVFNGAFDGGKVNGWTDCTFHGKVDMQAAGTTRNNVFHDSTNIVVYAVHFYMGYQGKDTAWAPISVTHQGTSWAMMCHTGPSYFADDVTITNSPVGNKPFYASWGTVTYDGDIYLNQTSGLRIRFLGSQHTVNGGIRTGELGIQAGDVWLTSMNQTTTDSVVMSNVAANSLVKVSGTFNGHVVLDSGNPYVHSGTYNGGMTLVAESITPFNSYFGGDTYFTKTGGTNNWLYGNTYAGDLYVKNQSNTNYLYLGRYNATDTVIGDLTLIGEGSSSFWFGYGKEIPVGGDVHIGGTEPVRVGYSDAGDYLKLNGSGDQKITIADGADHQVYRLMVDKPSGHVLLEDSLIVSHELHFAQGKIICQDEGMLTLLDGVTLSGVGDEKMVEGPVKKVGNDAFTFPVGRNGQYRPLEISAPTSASDEFVAEYFEHNSDPLYDHNSKDATLAYLSTNEYWRLNRTSGTSEPTVTLGWDSITSCGMTGSLTDIQVAAWSESESKWKDLGNGGTTGTIDQGEVETANGVAEFSGYTLANNNTLACNSCSDIVLEQPDTVITGTLLPSQTVIYSFPKLYGETYVIAFDSETPSDDSVGVDLDLYGPPCHRNEFVSSDKTGFILGEDFIEGTYSLRIEGHTTESLYYSISIRAGGNPFCENLVTDGSFEDISFQNNTCDDIIVNANWFTNTTNGCDWWHPNVPVSGTSGGDVCGLPGGGPPIPSDGVAHTGIAITQTGVTEFLWQPITFNPLPATYRISYDLNRRQGNGFLFVGTSVFPIIPGITTNQDIVNQLNDGQVSVDNGQWVSQTFGYQTFSFCYDHTGSQNQGIALSLFGPTIQGIQQYFFVDNIRVEETVCMQAAFANYCENTSPPLGTIVTPIGGSGYVWELIGPTGTTTQSGGTFDYGGLPAGEYTLNLTGTTPNGCISTFTESFEVYPEPTPEIVGNSSYCEGESGSNLSVSLTGPEYSFLWNTLETSQSIVAPSGTFEVSVIDANGCSGNSDPFVVTETIIPQITYELTYPSCGGFEDGEIELTLPFNIPGSTITWNPSNLSGNHVTGLGFGNYDVIWTYPDGCYRVENIFLPENPELEGTTTVTDHCPAIGWVGIDMTGGVPPYSYSWTPSDHLYSTTDSHTPIDWVNPPLPGEYTYTVLVTDANGCQYQDDVTINVGNCCFGDFTQNGPYTAQDGDLSSQWSSLSPIVAAPDAEDFAINGTFTVDQSITFDGMTIWMGALAQIIIEPNQTLTLQDCHVLPCQTYWTQIDVGEDATLIINGSIIERGVWAVHAHDDGSYDIQQSTFDQNLTSIWIESYTNPPSPGHIRGNTFEATEDVPITPSGQSYYGILAEDVPGLVVGDNTGQNPTNTFKQCQFGIKVENCDLDVDNNRFENIVMEDDGQGGIHFSGYAIYAEGDPSMSLVVDKVNEFFNVTHGIYGLDYGAVDIENNSFEKVAVRNELPGFDNRGVAVKIQGSGDVDIFDNHFLDCELGIAVHQMNGGDVLVRANQIGQYSGNTYNNAIGISVSGNADDLDIINHNEQAQSDGDDAYIKDMRIGIEVLQGSALQMLEIIRNDIYVNDAIGDFTAGIYMTASQARILYNQIYFPNGNNNDDDRGIYTGSNDDVTLICNTIDHPRSGIHRNGEVGPFAMYGTEFSGDQHVSIFNSSSSFPTQGTSNNPADLRWLDGSTFNWHTYNDMAVALPGGIYARPLPSTPITDDYEFNPLNWSSGGAFQIDLIDADQGAIGIGCSGLDYRNMPYVHGVALDTIDFTGDTIVAPKLAKLALFRAAKLDSTLGADAVVSAFVDSMQQTPFGELDSLNKLMVWNIDSTLADSLVAENVKVSATDSLESLWKEVNDLALKYVLGNDSVLDATNEAKLIGIAQLCPSEYGPGVLKARQFLASIDNDPLKWINGCENVPLPDPPSSRLAGPNHSSEDLFQESGRTEVLSVEVFPNPTTEIVNFNVSGTNGEVMQLRVSNILGEVVATEQLTADRTQVRMDLKAGTYLYEVLRSSGERMDLGKIVVLGY